MATSLTPDDLPNHRTDGRACDESCAGAIKTCKGCQSVSDARMGGGYGRFTPDS